MIPYLTAIGSGKGGTGKTLIAVNLACALASCGERVLLCDADLGLSNTSVHLGLEKGGDLPSVLSGKTHIPDAVISVNGGAAVPDGFDLLSAPAGSGALANATADDAKRLLIILRASPSYDRILLDLNAGVNDTTMAFAAGTDESLLVMTADPTSLTDAYAFAKLMARARAATPLVLVNMAPNEAHATRSFDALNATAKTFLKFEMNFLGSVPHDAKAADAVRRQQLLLSCRPDAAASIALHSIAQKLHGRIEPQPQRAQAGLR